MKRGRPSGYTLTTKDARIVLGMQARGDRDHDVAAWFGVNQGRVAEVKEGRFGTIAAAPIDELPPSGPPGVKGRRLRIAVSKALDLLSAEKPEDALTVLKDAQTRYDANEE